MTSYDTVAALGLLVLAITAGCTYPSASSNAVRFSGDIERVDGQFHMDGTVSIDGTNERDITDVQIVLYDANRTVIERVPVGSVSSHSEGPHPTRQSVEITTGRVPAYVIIESPDIWTNGVPSEGYRWMGDEYWSYTVESENDRFPPLPSPIPN